MPLGEINQLGRVEAGEKWFPSALNEDLQKNENTGNLFIAVEGRFGIYHGPNVKESKRQDMLVTRPRIICQQRVLNETNKDVSTAKVNQDNIGGFVKRFPEAWKFFASSSIDTGDKQTVADRFELEDERAVRYLVEGVITCEQLACADDTTCERIGIGAKTLRNKCREEFGMPVYSPDTADPMPAISSRPQIDEIAQAKMLEQEKTIEAQGQRIAELLGAVENLTDKVLTLTDKVGGDPEQAANEIVPPEEKPAKTKSTTRKKS